jgi:UDP-galactopyranose mutase
MRNPGALITFSHLRWSFVYQRPQHLLSRMAKRRPVYFVEEPVQTTGAPHWELQTPEPNVTVMRPHTTVEAPGFHDLQMPQLRELVRQFRASLGDRHSAWFYTPMALPLLEELSPDMVIYDCMDELSAFLHAPRQLLELEDRLFGAADVVFTGGPSLYKAKKQRHRNVHCFPSSVDVDHYSRGVKERAEAEDQARLPGPRLGYFGVIDERIDLGLLDYLAAAEPEWQMVMVGPVVKISEADLPRRPNIHYFGQKTYGELPRYLKGWDVSLLPFALNEATRFISPTKTLEYMAAGKPIVSTPIRDVEEPYGHIVYIADGPAAFHKACRQALEAAEPERARRMADAGDVLAGTSWDRTAERMEGAMEQVMTKKGGAVEDPVVVIGAGPTGLSAAYHLGERAELIEANETVGGWCRSVERDGFTFDFAGHIMFSADPYVHQMYQMLLGSNVHWQDREAWIYSKSVYTRYPFQGSLYGLPAEVIRECIMGAIASRFGVVKKKPNGHANGQGNGKANGAAGVCNDKGDAIADCCADGILESSTGLSQAKGAVSGGETGEPKNFEEFIYKVWGAGIAKHFAIPYNRKLWAVPLTEMETSWLGGRVPMPDLEEMIEGALQPTPRPMGPNARFGYPLRGGFQALMNGFLPHLRGKVLLNRRVGAIDPVQRVVTMEDGQQRPYSQLVSTMPLPLLVKALGAAAPREIQEAAAKLRYISVRCVNIGVGRENLTEKHWIYYPEDTVFHRVFVQGNASPHCNAPGGFGITCEITYSDEYKPLPCGGDELIARCIADCKRVGLMEEGDAVWTAFAVDMPHAYVVYDHARKEAVTQIRAWLAERGIHLAGRYSEWEYYNSDHAFLAGKKAAEEVVRRGEERHRVMERIPVAVFGRRSAAEQEKL